MTFFYRYISLFFIFLSCVSLTAQPWPFIIVHNDGRTVLAPSKKWVMRSRVSLEKSICSRITHKLLSEFSSISLKSLALAVENIFISPGAKSPVKIRVLLAQAKNDGIGIGEWRFACRQGFVVQFYDNDGRVKKTVHVKRFMLTLKRGYLFWKGKRIEGLVRLRSVSGNGEFNDISYDGDFCVMLHKDNFLCINQVGLEDYITAVLRTESWPGWPLEVNKVFAIACRSYVAFKLLEAKRSGRPYHVKNTNEHQTYGGRHEVAVLRSAVEQTRGMVLGFQGKPILAMFDCCCGSIIPAHIADFDFSKVPYLARTYACMHCKYSSLYSWQVSYDHAIFQTQLEQHFKDLILLSDIHVIKKDKAGLVAQVRLKGGTTTTIIQGKKLYSLLKEVKSFHFDVQIKGGKVIFNGRGFGHHIGLCQWGARQMVRDGYDYRSILRFYYPGTYFMHLI